MTNVTLEASDYEKIMDFALLDPFAYDYYKKIVSLLKTNFAGSLAACTTWSREGRLASYDSIGFSTDFMRQVHSIYIHDEIRNFIETQFSSNAWSGIFYSQEADPFTISDSQIIRYLNENNIHFFSIMVLSKSPRINLLSCKTEKEGPFSPREKAILGRLYDLLSHQVQLREKYLAKKQALELVNNYYSNKKTGLIITDSERTVLTYNKAALSLIPEKLNLKHIDDIVPFVFTLFGKDSSEADWDEHEQTSFQDGRYYTMETMYLMDEANRQTRYYLITIHRKKRYDNKIDLTVSARYGLTAREISVAELIVTGYSNYEISDQLHISIHTVKIHVSNLFRKLGAHSRMEAVMKLGGKG